MVISYCADTLVMGRTLGYYVKQNKFDKINLEKGILSWMPSKVEQPVALVLT